jgi:Zn-dependent protease
VGNLSQNSIRLFRIAGINVYLHWFWFLFAIYEISGRKRDYSSITWNILEYLSLFLIVLVHEFGHALACRQVGGNANKIVLWPLGGVAYVDPPPRPGATLWSIVAGPLVNVVLLPVLYFGFYAAGAAGWQQAMPDVYHLLRAVLWINAGLLVFNMLPVYPLDGGQILRSLLWFVLGRGRSLMAATVIGFLGAAGMVGLAIWMGSTWFFVLAAFVVMNCWGGLQQARVLLKMAKLPRREGFICPCCETAPPIGNYWKCAKCANAFDTFASGAVCPHCSAQFETTGCLDCRRAYPIAQWRRAETASSAAVAASSQANASFL